MLLALKVGGCFLAWTFYSYWYHRVCHSRFARSGPSWNPLRFLGRCHLAHHRNVIEHESYQQDFKGIPWHYWVFVFDSWRATVDVYAMFTVPLIALTFFDPLCGGILLGFHYLYEVTLGGKLVDHNPNIKGIASQLFPIGVSHLVHHADARYNLAFFFKLWDYLFGTAFRAEGKAKVAV